jgi:hypothetical protein
MGWNLMLLPARESGNIRLVRVPDDFQECEALRHVTGLIARVEEENPDYTPDDVLELLEDHGFDPVSFMIGPELD